MNIWKRVRTGLVFGGFAVCLCGQVGCLFPGYQTWVAGMTLPSGRYLEHPPQYFPPSPPFPLSRELAQQQAIAAAGIDGAPATVPLPPPVVPPAVPDAPVGGGAPPVPMP
jgi:hypothetical protein